MSSPVDCHSDQLWSNVIARCDGDDSSDPTGYYSIHSDTRRRTVADERTADRPGSPVVELSHRSFRSCPNSTRDTFLRRTEIRSRSTIEEIADVCVRRMRIGIGQWAKWSVDGRDYDWWYENRWGSNLWRWHWLRERTEDDSRQSSNEEYERDTFERAFATIDWRESMCCSCSRARNARRQKRTSLSARMSKRLSALNKNVAWPIREIGYSRLNVSINEQTQE